MDKKIASLVGALSAVSAAAPGTSAMATPEAYANLVRPIPNALTALMVDEATRPKSEVGDIQEAQYYYHHHHHHHHHHHRWWRRRYYHHHHHHHHHHHRWYHHHWY